MFPNGHFGSRARAINHLATLRRRVEMPRRFKGRDLVVVAVEPDGVFACTRGRLWSLDLGTGAVRWVNELPGLGYGPPSLPRRTKSRSPWRRSRRQPRRRQSWYLLPMPSFARNTSGIALSVVVALSIADAGAELRSYAAECRYDIAPDTLTWRAFAQGETQDQPRLFFSERVEGDPGYFVRSEGGRCLGRIERNILEFVNTCRHPVSGRNHTLIYAQSGAYLAFVQVWSVDPATGNPVRDYDEITGDLLLQGVGMEELVAVDGSCVWQERKEGQRLLDEAMPDLRVGTKVNFGEVSELPTRIVPAATVHKWLNALDGFARIEGPVYTSDADREAWRVVQVRGIRHCETEGVVLLLDRKTGVWRAIYDVPSGCTKVLSFTLRHMVIEDNRLTAWACRICDSWGSYEKFAVDLRTHRVVTLEEGETMMGYDEGWNLPVGDIDRELFSD